MLRGLCLWAGIAACAGDGGPGVVDTEDDVVVTGDPALGPRRVCEVVLASTFLPGTDVSVAGSFNGWEPAPMSDRVGDGVFRANLGRLAPGVYAYKLVFDAGSGSARWEDPPPDVSTVWDGGFENRALRVGDCEQPSLVGLSATATPDGAAEATFRWEQASDGGALDAGQLTVTFGDTPGRLRVDHSTGLITATAGGLPPGKHSVRLHGRDTSGRAAEQGTVYLPLWVEAEPFDWSDGLMYFAFTDRFRDGGDDGAGPIAGAQHGTDYFGGDLVGVRQALEEGWFEALGVRSLWLSPVYDNPEASFVGGDGVTRYTGYHGYWPIRGRAVENRFGTLEETGEEALKALVDAAHARGIRVLLDGVLNHVHDEHEYLSSHPEWFGASPCPCTTDPGPCNWDGNPIGCWFTDYLPDLDYKNPAVVEQMLDDARWWVETFDVDGFRVDAAKHMDHVIMRSLSLRTKELYQDPTGVEFYNVGETFTFLGNQGLIMDYVADYELGGQFDFPLYYALDNALTQNRWREVSNQAWAGKNVYGRFVDRMSPFFGNHDVARLATRVHGCPTWALFGGCEDVMMQPGPISDAQWNVINRLTVGFGVVSTFPGVPLLYYGDELGLAGGGDPDNRRVMPWGELTPAQDELLARFRRLGQLRAQHPALQHGEWRELWVNDGDDLFVYARDNGGGDVALVALRLGWSAQRSWSIPIPPELLLDGATFSDGMGSGRTVSVVGGRVQIEADPWQVMVLVQE